MYAKERHSRKVLFVALGQVQVSGYTERDPGIIHFSDMRNTPKMDVKEKIALKNIWLAIGFFAEKICLIINVMIQNG